MSHGSTYHAQRGGGHGKPLAIFCRGGVTCTRVRTLFSSDEACIQLVHGVPERAKGRVRVDRGNTNRKSGSE